MYQGTELVITCTATVDSAVNTGFDVTITWSGEPAEVMDGTYVTISGTSGSGHLYTSTVTISPVNTTDNLTFTCTASVISTEDEYIISSTNNTATMNIEVAGEYVVMYFMSDSDHCPFSCRADGTSNHE